MTQRIIKFRAWDKSLKLMGLVDVLEWHQCRTLDDPKDLIYIRASHPCCYEMQTGSEKHLADYVLMQCTGLLDSKGKEAYEGDLVKVEMSSGSWEKGEIYWDERGAGLGVRTKPNNMELGFNDFGQFEIIGNIHQNPELLTPSH